MNETIIHTQEEMEAELYATYEEYQDIAQISELLNSENEQLEIENEKLKQEKQELIEWLKEEIISQKKSIELLNDKNNNDIHIGAIYELKKVLERLGE